MRECVLSFYQACEEIPLINTTRSIQAQTRAHSKSLQKYMILSLRHLSEVESFTIPADQSTTGHLCQSKQELHSFKPLSFRVLLNSGIHSLRRYYLPHLQYCLLLLFKHHLFDVLYCFHVFVFSLCIKFLWLHAQHQLTANSCIHCVIQKVQK